MREEGEDVEKAKEWKLEVADARITKYSLFSYVTFFVEVRPSRFPIPLSLFLSLIDETLMAAHTCRSITLGRVGRRLSRGPRSSFSISGSSSEATAVVVPGSC